MFVRMNRLLPCSYTKDLLCAICNSRKAKRPCPGVHGDICPVCCAEGREETVDCPPDCGFLRDAHRHERLPTIDPDILPNRDVDISEEFLQANEHVLVVLSIALNEAVLETPQATDWDIRESLEALIRTWRTIASGLVYETQPDNLYAAGIATRVKDKIDQLRQREMEATGTSSSWLKDSSILGALVFLQRLEYANNNGRKRSRAFIDFLARFYVPAIPEEEDAESPEASRVIL